MEKKRNDYPRLDMSKVSSKPSKTTSDTDIVPIKWNNEVLTGKLGNVFAVKLTSSDNVEGVTDNGIDKLCIPESSVRIETVNTASYEEHIFRTVT